MARAILASPPAGSPVCTYTLAAADAFVVLAASVQYGGNGGGDPAHWFDYRDPAGHIIAMQMVANTDSDPVLVALGSGSQLAISVNDGIAALYDPAQTQEGNVVVSPLIDPTALGPGCTVNAYITNASGAWTGDDPLENVDSASAVVSMHLWVEDVAKPFDLTPVGNPILIGTVAQGVMV